MWWELHNNEKKIFNISDIYTKYEKFFLENNMNIGILKIILQEKLNDDWLNFTNISDISRKKSIFEVVLTDNTTIKISLSELRKRSIKEIFWDTNIKDTEKKAENILQAMYSIYGENEGYIWNDEIDDTDIIDTDTFWKELKGKNLIELKALLDIENSKLKVWYLILWETKKYTQILKTEIEVLWWTIDLTEWAARYFSLSKKDIKHIVAGLSNSMEITELIDYIVKLNKDIDANYKKSEMVKHVTMKIMNSLATKTFERLMKEDASNSSFIYFAKSLTGRWKVQIDKNKDYKDTWSFSYDDLDIDSEYKMVNLANKALLYTMYRENGVLSSIKETIHIEDPYIWKRNTREVINDAAKWLEMINPSMNWIESIKGIITEAWFEDLLAEEVSYEQLNIEQKILIGSIARIGFYVYQNSWKYTINFNNLTVEEKEKKIKKNIELLDSLAINITKESEESYEKELWDAISEKFDTSFSHVNGMSAIDLGLTGDLAEIFELYKDINGNGLWDLADTTKDWLMWKWTMITLAVWITVWAIVLSPILAAAGTGAVITTGIFAWMEAGTGVYIMAWALSTFAPWITSSIVTRQWYDSFSEWAKNIWWSLSVDALLWGAILAKGIPILVKMWNVNPDLFLSKAAWTTKAWLMDKSLIIWETWAGGILVWPTLQSIIKKSYPENNFDTDKTNYHSELKKKKKLS